MAGMSFIGSYSGIDQNTIDQLMQAERLPIKQLENKKTSITEKQNAWKDINTRLNSLFEKMNALGKGSTFNTKNAVSSDDKYVTMSAGTSAADGKYNIKIDQLASNSSLVGSKVDNIIADLGLSDGSKLTIKSGKVLEGFLTEDTNFDITINSGDSLRDVVSKINETTKETDISATIIDGRIVLNDGKTGERKIEISSSSNVLTATGLDESKWDINKGEGVKIGNNSQFTLNGITITRDTNTISDAIEGVTINLNKVHDKNDPNQVDVVNISSDTEKAAKAVQDFVDQYNSTMKFIEEKTVAGDPKVPGSKGVLSGEGSLMRLQSTLRTKITDALNGDKDSLNTASKLGISTQDRFGELKFDKTKFLEELSKDKDAVMKFFSNEVEETTIVDGESATKKVDKGLIGRVNDYIDSFISKKDGLIKSQTESFAKSLKDLSDRIENFEARMVKKEAYYVKTFTALDLAMMKAESQMQWLQGQVDSMNGVKR